MHAMWYGMVVPYHTIEYTIILYLPRNTVELVVLCLAVARWCWRRPTERAAKQAPNSSTAEKSRGYCATVNQETPSKRLKLFCLLTLVRRLGHTHVLLGPNVGLCEKGCKLFSRLELTHGDSSPQSVHVGTAPRHSHKTITPLSAATLFVAFHHNKKPFHANHDLCTFRNITCDSLSKVGFRKMYAWREIH
jgi:hypothetical protein